MSATPKVPRCSRRRFLSVLLAGVAAATAGIAPGELFAAQKAKRAKKLISAKRSAKGTTLTFHLKHAPYPKSARKYRDPTVVVFVPKYYRLPRRRYADMVVHIHGHGNTAARAVAAHQLHAQLYDSKQNAILIVPQGPVMAVDSNFGQLEKKNGLRKLLAELCQELRRSRIGKLLGKASLARVRGPGAVCMSAHSGGYRAVAACLKRGGVNVNEVYLFDALYGQVKTFRDWVVARHKRKGRGRHKLVSFYAGGSVRKNNLALLRQLKSAGVKTYHETGRVKLTRAQLTKGTAVFIGSRLRHSYTAYKHNNFRDCLYASVLKRHHKSKWFKNKNKPRKVESRGG